MFPIALYLAPPLREFSLEFCNGGSAQNNQRIWKEFDDMCIRFDTVRYQSVTDGRTDGFAITISLSPCIEMLTRGKNLEIA